MKLRKIMAMILALVMATALLAGCGGSGNGGGAAPAPAEEDPAIWADSLAESEEAPAEENAEPLVP